MRFAVAVDMKTCSGWEKCVEVCTVQVFKMKEGRSVPVNGNDCTGCGSCIQACEEEAISVDRLPPELSGTARSLLRDIL